MSDSVKTSFQPPDGPQGPGSQDGDPKVKMKIKVKGVVPVSQVQQLLKGRG